MDSILFQDFYNLLQTSYLFPHWSASSNYGFGSPILIFTPSISYYLGSIIKYLFGFSFEFSSKISIYLLYILIIFLSYGLFVSIKRQKFFRTVIILFLLFLSMNYLMVIVITILLILLAFTLKKKNLILCFLMALSMSAFYWFPALMEHFQWQSFQRKLKFMNLTISQEDKLQVLSGKEALEINYYYNISQRYQAWELENSQPVNFSYHQLYYPGWKVILDKKEINFSKNKFIDFTVNEGNHILEIVFTDTPIRIIGKVVSFLSIGFFISYFSYDYFKKNS